MLAQRMALQQDNERITFDVDNIVLVDLGRRQPREAPSRPKGKPWVASVARHAWQPHAGYPIT